MPQVFTTAGTPTDPLLSSISSVGHEYVATCNGHVYGMTFLMDSETPYRDPLPYDGQAVIYYLGPVGAMIDPGSPIAILYTPANEPVGSQINPDLDIRAIANVDTDSNFAWHLRSAANKLYIVGTLYLPSMRTEAYEVMVNPDGTIGAGGEPEVMTLVTHAGLDTDGAPRESYWPNCGERELRAAAWTGDYSGVTLRDLSIPTADMLVTSVDLSVTGDIAVDYGALVGFNLDDENDTVSYDALLETGVLDVSSYVMPVVSGDGVLYSYDGRFAIMDMILDEDWTMTGDYTIAIYVYQDTVILPDGLIGGGLDYSRRVFT